MDGGAELERIMQAVLADAIECRSAIHLAYVKGFRAGLSYGLRDAKHHAAGEIVKVGEQHKPEVQS